MRWTCFHKHKNVSGVNVQTGVLVIDYTYYEANIPSLVNEIYYKDFKANFINYPRMPLIEKTVVKAQIFMEQSSQVQTVTSTVTSTVISSKL